MGDEGYQGNSRIREAISSRNLSTLSFYPTKLCECYKIIVENFVAVTKQDVSFVQSFFA